MRDCYILIQEQVGKNILIQFNTKTLRKNVQPPDLHIDRSLEMVKSECERKGVEQSYDWARLVCKAPDCARLVCKVPDRARSVCQDPNRARLMCKVPDWTRCFSFVDSFCTMELGSGPRSLIVHPKR